MFSYEFTELEIKLLQRYMLERTVPLIHCVDGGTPKLLGSSTLLEISKRLFLITAEHVLEQVDSRDIAIPENPYKADLLQLGKVDRVRVNEDPDEFDTDIELVEVLAPEAQQCLRAGWKSLPLDQISGAASNLPFVVFGYPKVLTELIDDYLRGEPLTAYVPLLSEIPANACRPVDRSLDVFLDARSPEHLREGAVVLPRLKGVSGASLWQFRPASGGRAWAPENVLRVVGVTTAFSQGLWIRAKLWWPVPQMLERIEERPIDENDVLYLKKRVSEPW